MGLLLLIAGLILLLAGGSWFAGAATVGVICLIVGAVLFVGQLIVQALAARTINRVRKDIDRRRF